MALKHPENVIFHISPQSVVYTVLILLLFIVLFVLRDLLLVVLMSVIIAASVEPIAKWFISYRIPRVPTVIAIYVGLALIISTFFYFLLLPLLNEMSQVLDSLPEYIETIELWSISDSSFIGSQPVVQGIQESLSFSEVAENINETISTATGGAFSTISLVFGGIFSFLVTIILSFYLCVQERGIQRFLSMIFPTTHKEYVLDLWDRSEKKIGLWFQGQLLLVVIIAVLTYLGLLLLSVEHALLLAALAGLFEIIPLFGPLLAAIPAIAIAFITGDATLALLVAGLYLIIQQFENQLIYPLVVHKVVGVPPIIVILAMIAGGTLAGFIGVLLSVPVAAILLEILHDYQKRIDTVQ